MNRTSFFYFSLAAIATGSFISCQDYNPFDESTLQHLNAQKAFEATLNEYTKNFEDRYGKIDPNHDWGMFMPGIKENATRSTVDNRNEWVTKYHLEVPGWPDNYYDTSGNLHTENGYHYNNSAGVNASYSGSGDVPSGSHPAGDVTDEEIQYVSWWFRTHQYPKSINLHWTDFYVQGISADNDRDASGNRIDILERYKKNSSGTFDLDVANSDHTTYTIDYFSAMVLQDFGTNSDGGWDHIKNYNRNNSNLLNDVPNLYVGSSESSAYSLDSNYKNAIDGADITNRLIAFYQSSGTENFEAFYSQNSTAYSYYEFYNNDGTVDHSKGTRPSWVLRHLHFTGPSGRVYDGYYLGFDYQIYKNEGEDKYTLHKADGYYSNWIFKLSPATPHKEVNNTGLSRRIMCEDLGNTYDFDFNDVVFDATYNITQEEYDQYLSGTLTITPIDVTITLQAAGGTLPIYVGEAPRGRADMEAHHLLGNHASNDPVNVNAPGGATSAVAIYHYQLEFPQNLTSDEERRQALSLNRIPIYVVSPDNEASYLTNSDTYWADPDYTDYENHKTPSNTGDKAAPRAFGVPVGVCWMEECKFIEESYTNFPKWVQNMAAYGDSSETPWYISPISNTDIIYSYLPYTPPTSSPGSTGPEIYDVDYSQYGTLLPVTEKTIGYQDLRLIDFNDFPEQPGKYNVTALCVAKNQTNGIQNASLQRFKWNDAGHTSWSTESNKDITAVYTLSDDFAKSKLYTVTFVVDINENYFDDYTHYVVNNMVSSDDIVGNLYVMRIGNSTQSGASTVEYPQYGVLATYSLVEDEYHNPSCYIDLSSFTNKTDGKYTISIICQTQNDAFQWNGDVKLRMTDKAMQQQDINGTSCAKSVIDSGMKMIVVQIPITFPLSSSDSDYTHLEVLNIFNGLNESPSVLKAIKEIRIAVTNESNGESQE